MLSVKNKIEIRECVAEFVDTLESYARKIKQSKAKVIMEAIKELQERMPSNDGFDMLDNRFEVLLHAFISYIKLDLILGGMGASGISRSKVEELVVNALAPEEWVDTITAFRDKVIAKIKSSDSLTESK